MYFYSVVKRIRIRILSVVQTRDFWIRVLFLVIAIFFWFLLKLSKTGYVSTVTYPVVYENIPNNKILIDAPTKAIKLRVTSYGFRLLGYALRSEKPLPLDVKRSVRRLSTDKNVYYWLPNLYRDELQAQLDGQTTLLRLEPDTVFLKMSEKVRKKVPVKSKVSTSFSKGYSAYNTHELAPAYVTVAGPEMYLDTLKQVFTEPLVIKDIKRDQKVPVAVKLNHPMLTVQPELVLYTLPVDQFTEKEIAANITLINVPKGENISIFPSKVNLHFRIALRDYHLLTADAVSVLCDFDQLLQYPQRKRLQLDITCMVPNAVLFRNTAQTVDYLRFKE